MDEVDVFFDRKKITKTLSEVAHVKHLYIAKICDLIWNNKENIDSFRDLKKVQGFKKLLQKCLDSFDKAFESRIKREINDMVQDVQIFRNVESDITKDKPYNYVVRNDKIGHCINDYVDFNTNRRYKTLFAYYYENELGMISDESLNKAKHLLIVCCSFSFALMPGLFTSIMGVTATLDKLSKNQLKLLEKEYNITQDKFTIMPSVFKKASTNNKNANDQKSQLDLKFDKNSDVKAFDDKNFHAGLVQEINFRQKKECPVIAFFINNDALSKFVKCDKFEYNDYKILNEECTSIEKQQAIRDACDLKAITLATRIFGRGTDFQVVDEIIEKDEIGGPHVIQTFFSEEESEEIQIQGRTARYGGKGAYSMILSKSMVKERFNIDLDKKISAKKNVYQILHEKRQDSQANGYEELMSKIEQSKKRHKVSKTLLSALTAKCVNVDQVSKCLDALKDEIDGKLTWLEEIMLG